HPRLKPATRSNTEAAPDAALPEVFIGTGRERRLIERVAAASAPALVIVPDVEAAGRWTQRLEKYGVVARLASGVDDATRAGAWAALTAGDARLAVGTRSALLAPLPAGATLALVDEHEAAHKPPGPPRLHSRDVVLERAARGGLDAVLTSATPSVETWWRADSGRARLVTGEPAPWPAIQLADTRGILRREPSTRCAGASPTRASRATIPTPPAARKPSASARRPRPPRSSSARAARCGSSVPPRSAWPASCRPTTSCACRTSAPVSACSRSCGPRPSACCRTAASSCNRRRRSIT